MLWQKFIQVSNGVLLAMNALNKQSFLGLFIKMDKKAGNIYTISSN